MICASRPWMCARRYEMTGRTIVEAGLTLAIGNQDNIKAGGVSRIWNSMRPCTRSWLLLVRCFLFTTIVQVLTPAACMGKELLKRLKENAEITLDIHWKEWKKCIVVHSSIIDRSWTPPQIACHAMQPNITDHFAEVLFFLVRVWNKFRKRS